MKRQWKIKRTEKEYPDGEKRWSRAYQLLLEIAQSTEVQPTEKETEERHASSNLRQSVNTESNSEPDD